MASNDELACVYAALILQDDEIGITAEKINSILKAANVAVEPYWPTLFAKALEGCDLKSLITNVGSGVGSAAVGAVAAPVAAAAAGDSGKAAAKKEEKQEEEEDEDEDMGFGLFD